MGVVYRAHDTLLEREVALKVISTSIESSPELRERFFREARAAGQLSHRNIITIHDLGEHEGQPYLAMEYLDGEDLQKRLARPEPMSLARKLEIAAEVCEGLYYAHRRGLIHRDIKPANIFITDDGIVKILDFGLARMVTSEMTASNMMLGTLNYMAPEQVRGERTDHRADIFSFGVVLYEILSGRKAFQGDSFATTLYKILQDIPEPLQNIDASLPHEVVRLVEKSIAKGKDERYQDLSELARDLALHRQHLALSDSDTMEIPVPSAFRSTERPGSGSTPRPDSAQRPKSGAKSGPRPAPQQSEADASTMLADATTALSPSPVGHSRSRVPTIAAAAAVLALVLGVAWISRRDRAAPPAATASTAPAPAAEQTPLPAPAGQTAGPSTVPLPPATVAPPAVPPANDTRSVEDARSRMASAKTAARRQAAAQRSPSFAAALAAEREGNRLASAKQFSEAAAKFYEAAGLYRSAELTPESARATEQAKPEPAKTDPVTTAAIPPASPQQTPPSPAPTAPQQPPPAPQPAPAPVETPVQTPPAAVPGPPIPQVTRNPPPSALPATSPRAIEEEVRELLRRYEQALEARSIDALKRIWPSLQGAQEQAIREEFSHARRIEVDINSPDINISGATATITFVRRYQLSTTDNQRLLTTSRTTMNARRAGSEWLIDRVRFEAIR